MKLSKLLLLSLFLVACGPRVTKYNNVVCTCAQMAKVQEFVSLNVKAANNMSDEEMEDVIYELWKVGVMTTCPKRTVTYIDDLPVLDSCETQPLNY